MQTQETLDWQEDIDRVPYNQTEEYKEQRKLWYVANCCKPLVYFDKNGNLQSCQSRRCKQYHLCPICAAWKKQQLRERLDRLVGKRLLEVDLKDEARIARKYGKDNYIRIPVSEDKATFIIDTDDEVGSVLQTEDCDFLQEFAVSVSNRHMSGDLGKEIEYTIDYEQMEEEMAARREATKGQVKVEEEVEYIDYREMSIKYDNETGPQNPNELEQIVHDEVEIYDTPANFDQLQWYIYMLEEKVKEICERYGMSFSFFSNKQFRVKMSEINWKWTENKTQPV